MKLLKHERKHEKVGYDSEDVLNTRRSELRYLLRATAELSGNMDAIIFLADCDNLWEKAELDRIRYQREDFTRVVHQGKTTTEAAAERNASIQSVSRNVKSAKQRIIDKLEGVLDEMEWGGLDG